MSGGSHLTKWARNTSFNLEAFPMSSADYITVFFCTIKHAALQLRQLRLTWDVSHSGKVCYDGSYCLCWGKKMSFLCFSVVSKAGTKNWLTGFDCFLILTLFRFKQTITQKHKHSDVVFVYSWTEKGAKCQRNNNCNNTVIEFSEVFIGVGWKDESAAGLKCFVSADSDPCSVESHHVQQVINKQ